MSDPLIAAKAKANLSTHTQQGYQKSDKAIHTIPELARISGLLHEIRDLLRDHFTSASRCSAEDRAILSRLLPAIAGTFGSQGLPVREILRDPAIRELCAPLNSQHIGNLLARAAADGLVVDGLQVSRIATEGNASVWQVTRRLPDTIPSATPVCDSVRRRISTK